jgi:hypothetical protein
MSPGAVSVPQAPAAPGARRALLWYAAFFLALTVVMLPIGLIRLRSPAGRWVRLGLIALFGVVYAGFIAGRYQQFKPAADERERARLGAAPASLASPASPAAGAGQTLSGGPCAELAPGGD